MAGGAMTRRRRPPWGSELRAHLASELGGWYGTSADGKRPAVFFLIGPDAWRLAHRWRADRLLTLLPPGEDSRAFDWGVLRGSDPLLLVRCGAIAGADLMVALQALAAAGVARVLDITTMTLYRARGSDAA